MAQLIRYLQGSLQGCLGCSPRSCSQMHTHAHASDLGRPFASDPMPGHAEGGERAATTMEATVEHNQQGLHPAATATSTLPSPPSSDIVGNHPKAGYPSRVLAPAKSVARAALNAAVMPAAATSAARAASIVSPAAAATPADVHTRRNDRHNNAGHSTSTFSTPGTSSEGKERTGCGPVGDHMRVGRSVGSTTTLPHHHASGSACVTAF